MDAFYRRAFLGEGADMEYLCACTFCQSFESEVRQCVEFLLRAYVDKSLSDELFGDRWWLHNHRRPFPIRLVCRRELGHVVGPPLPLERNPTP